MPDVGLEGGSSILAELISIFFYFFVIMHVAQTQTTNSTRAQVQGARYNQLSVTLYTPAARQQSKKQHHACAVDCPRRIAVAS